MIGLVTNLLLALLWALAIGPFTPANFLAGFAVGYAALLLATPRSKRGLYHDAPWKIVIFVLYFLWELLVANFRVARYTISPLRSLRPAILAVDIEGMRDAEITTLAIVVTFTPGTLTLDISADKKLMYVHFMHIDDADRARREVTHGFKRLLLEVTR